MSIQKGILELIAKETGRSRVFSGILKTCNKCDQKFDKADFFVFWGKETDPFDHCICRYCAEEFYGDSRAEYFAGVFHNHPWLFNEAFPLGSLSNTGPESSYDGIFENKVTKNTLSLKETFLLLDKTLRSPKYVKLLRRQRK